MAFNKQDVIDRAVVLGQLDDNDPALMERLDVTVEQVLTKTEIYLGYDPTTVDTLLNIEAEISVSELSHYQNLQTGGNTNQGSTKRITRGDYTVEYDTQNQATVNNQLFFSTYDWLLKKYKKLRTL